MGCGNICALPSKHDGDCLCNNSPEEHLCNGICDLFDKARGCKEYCKLKANHTEKEHICALEKEHHLCNEICFLKDETRTLEGKKCLIKCCYDYGHSGNHICSINEIHICNNPCYLKDKSRNCKELCKLYYGHDEKVEHNCLESHICNQSCFYNQMLSGSKNFIYNMLLG